MERLFVPTLGPTDWRRLLASPKTQWKRNQSALEMAVCWEAARQSERGLPPEVESVLDASSELRGASLLIGIPEHQVQFEGGGHPSQNDLWALLGVGRALVSLTIEAKAGERLDELVEIWLSKKAPPETKKPARLAALKSILAIDTADVAGVRYQLLHRTASALTEAERFGAQYAVMCIQSFNRQADEQSWEDFVKFGKLMGITPSEGAVVRSPRSTAVPLFLGWITSRPADVEVLGAAI